MEVDNWQIDINATESSTKDASELEKLWTATEEAAGGSITVRLWKWHQERTIKQFVCTWSHYILDFFGGNLCRNCGATHTQHDRRRYRFSSRAPWLQTQMCWFSSEPLQTPSAHWTDRAKWSQKKNMIHTRFFLQCSLKWGYQTLVAGSKNRMAGVLLGVGKLCPSGDHQLTGHILSES